MRIGYLVSAIVVLLLPELILAQDVVVLPAIPAITPCPVDFLPCGEDIGPGAEGLATYMWDVLFPALRIFFIAIGILFLLKYSITMLLDPDSSETVTSTKTAYGYAIVGFAIVGIATFVVEAIGSEARENLVNPEPLKEGIGYVILYMRLVVATLVTLFLLMQGVRMIIKQGSDEEFGEARTHFLHVIMGIAVILIANVIVSAFTEKEGSVLLAAEIVGIINFTLTLIGALAVATVVVAGMLLVISVDETLKDRAKKIITTAAVALVVCIMSYIMVTFFINLGYSPTAFPTINVSLPSLHPLLFVETAHAQTLSEIADSVSNGLLPFFGDGSEEGGASAYVGLAKKLLDQSWLIVGIFTSLLLVRSGIKLIYGQGEERYEEAKRAIGNGVMAVVLTALTQSLVDAFYTEAGMGVFSEDTVATGSSLFTLEILGIVRWVQVLVAVLAIGMIISSAFQALLSMGSEDGPTKMKQAVFGAAIGIAILAIDVAFREMFSLKYNEEPGDSPNPFPIIAQVLAALEYLLTFMAFIATAVVIYAGIIMIVYLGNEEKFGEAKSLILRALLGLIVILVSFTVVRFIVGVISGNLVCIGSYCISL